MSYSNNNNNDKNILNNTNNKPVRSLTNNQWNQSNRPGFTPLTNIRSFEDDDSGFRSNGFRNGPVMLDQNYNGSDFLSNPFDSFPTMMSNSLGKGFGVSNTSSTVITNSFDSMSNMKDMNNFIGQPFEQKLNTGNNGPKIIVPVPIYSNFIDQDSIDTCCHLSKVLVQVIQQTLVKLLETILKTNEIQIDFQLSKKNQFEFSGRVYTTSSSEFIIKIYKLKQKDNKGNISVVEIRKVFGDEFGYYKFEELLLKKLQNENILHKEQNTGNVFGMPLSMDFGSLTLDDSDDEMIDLDDFSDNNTLSLMQENDEEFDSNYCETMLETLYSKDSFREEYMHDAYQLSTCLEKNDKRSKKYD